MTVVMDPLPWEGEGERLALPYGLAAVVERDATERAIRWAYARPNRWRAVKDAARSQTKLALGRAAVKAYEADARRRKAYVKALIERGGRRD